MPNSSREPKSKEPKQNMPDSKQESSSKAQGFTLGKNRRQYEKLDPEMTLKPKDKRSKGHHAQNNRVITLKTTRDYTQRDTAKRCHTLKKKQDTFKNKEDTVNRIPCSNKSSQNSKTQKNEATVTMIGKCTKNKLKLRLTEQDKIQKT